MASENNPRILKFPLQVNHVQDIEMPVGSAILHAGDQRGTPCIWAMCTSGYTISRRFHVVGTGIPMPPMHDWQERKYIGTSIGDVFVWHVFEVVAKEDTESMEDESE